MTSAREVWLCAGQSNMLMSVAGCAEADEAHDFGNGAAVAFYDRNRWVNIDQNNVNDISAVAWFFAAERSRRTGRSLGITVAAAGGTGIEAWLPAEYFPDTPQGREFARISSDPGALEASAADKADPRPYGEHRLFRWGLGRALPGELYAAHIAPLRGSDIDGVLWYQGESNAVFAENASEYGLWLKGLIKCYRVDFRNNDMPFIIVQLPQYTPPSTWDESAWGIVRDEQSRVAGSTVNCGLVDITDLGESGDIHPKRKRDVGVRAADAADRAVNKVK